MVLQIRDSREDHSEIKTENAGVKECTENYTEMVLQIKDFKDHGEIKTETAGVKKCTESRMKTQDPLNCDLKTRRKWIRRTIHITEMKP
jgi:hypothetical protein